MKTKHLKPTLSILTATLSLALYSNFSFTDWTFHPTLDDVNEASRISHAKELLGASYAGSSAHHLEGQKSLNYSLFKKVQVKLSSPWKAQASALTETLIRESARYQFDPVFVLAVIHTESRFNPLARGQFGEIGLMQIKPSTAQWIAQKFDIPWEGPHTLEDPCANIRLGMAYMHYLRTQFPGKAQKYVSAYNMGPRNVRRLSARNIKPAIYSNRVMKNYFALYSSLAPTTNTLLAVN